MIIANFKTAIDLKVGDIFKTDREQIDWFQCVGILYLNALLTSADEGFVVTEDDYSPDFEIEIAVPTGYMKGHRAILFLRADQRIYVIDQTAIKSTTERRKLLYGRFINSS